MRASRPRLGACAAHTDGPRQTAAPHAPGLVDCWLPVPVMTASDDPATVHDPPGPASVAHPGRNSGAAGLSATLEQGRLTHCQGAEASLRVCMACQCKRAPARALRSQASSPGGSAAVMMPASAWASRTWRRLVGLRPRAVALAAAVLSGTASASAVSDLELRLHSASWR